MLRFLKCEFSAAFRAPAFGFHSDQPSQQSKGQTECERKEEGEAEGKSKSLSVRDDMVS